MRVDSLLGGRKVTEKMKQTIRSKLEMLKRSSSQTNGDLAIRADLYLAIRADLLAPECSWWEEGDGEDEADYQV